MDAKPSQHGHILGRKSLAILAFQTYHLKSDKISQMARNDRSKQTFINMTSITSTR
jgi:hypothetical protein